jgi:antitoxin (DNA-binding transcriptional repressor) of toxin-antitoxin stability system
MGESMYLFINSVMDNQMTKVSIGTAKSQLSELNNKARQGEVIEIEEHGKPMATLVAAVQARQPIDMAWLQSVSSSVPSTSADHIRQMRDADRY